MTKYLIHYFEYFFENYSFHNFRLHCSRCVCVGFSKFINFAIDIRVQLMSIALTYVNTVQCTMLNVNLIGWKMK